jgi:hypothetical protein
MDLETFITAIYCVIDEFLQDFTKLHAPRHRLRERGPAPTLADSEVLTLEVAGEFLGLDTDQAIFAHFRRHHAALFPRLRAVHRTTFARQAANLWVAKRALWQALLAEVACDPQLSIIDSVPVPICRFARAKRCRLFAGDAAFGYDELAHQTCYGFRAHVRVAWPGVITALELAPANASDLALTPEVLAAAPAAHGWVLADRNYWNPTLRATLAEAAVLLLAPMRTKAQERKSGAAPWPRWLIGTRRRIETVLGQLAERYHAKRIWARDRWHLTARWLRKIVSHTLAVLLCQRAGLSPLTFAHLLAR